MEAPVLYRDPLGLGLGITGTPTPTLIKTEYWNRVGGGGNISYDW